MAGTRFDHAATGRKGLTETGTDRGFWRLVPVWVNRRELGSRTRFDQTISQRYRRYLI